MTPQELIKIIKVAKPIVHVCATFTQQHTETPIFAPVLANNNHLIEILNVLPNTAEIEATYNEERNFLYFD